MNGATEAEWQRQERDESILEEEALEARPSTTMSTARRRASGLRIITPSAVSSFGCASAGSVAVPLWSPVHYRCDRFADNAVPVTDRIWERPLT